MGLFKSLKGAAFSQIKKQLNDPANQARALDAASSLAKKGVGMVQGKIARMKRGGKVRRVRRLRRGGRVRR